MTITNTEPTDEELLEIWVHGHLPTDQELANDDGEQDLLFLFTSACYRSLDDDLEARAQHEAKCLRAVFNAGRAWGRPAAPSAPVGEVGELVEWMREIGDQIQPSHLAVHQRYKRAAELLQQQDASMDYARQCNTQAVAALLALEALADAADQFGPAGGADGRALAAEVEKARGVMARVSLAQQSPIPVAERLPKPEDCDPDGYCWWFDANDGWLWLAWGDGFAWGAITHWLPAHAIPLPRTGEGRP